MKVERISGTAPFYAYGVINDQPTSDGSFVPPVVASSLAGKAGLTLPRRPRRPPQGPHLRRGRLPHRSWRRRLGPRARGAHLGPGRRRFGLFYTGVPYGDAATSTAWLYGLQQNAENRTNVAIVNTGEVDGSPSSFRIELFDGATGNLVKAIDGISIAARGFGQLSSILAQHAPGTSSAYARVTRTDGRNPFLCYAVVNDDGAPGQRSDDGAFVPMDLAEEAAPVPSLSVSPPAVEFGSVAVGQTSDRTVDLTNAGGGALHVSALSVAGTGFRLLSPAAPLAVAAGVTQGLSLRFEPASAGPFAGTLTVASDDPARPAVAVALSGTGAAVASPRIEVSPSSLDFGKVAVGSSRDLPLVLRNGGGATLSVTTLFVSHPAFTVQVASLPASIAPGAQLTVPVRFAPVAAGSLSLSLLVGSNDPASPQVVVPLQGEGTTTATVTEELAIDDGTIESGFGADGLFVVNRLTPTRYPATLKSIRYLHVQYEGLPGPAGMPVRVVAFTDPSGSGTPPASPVFAVDQTVTLPAVPSGGAGWIDLVLVNGPVVASGDLYVGLRPPATPTGVAIPADTNGTQRRRGYYSTDGGVTFRGPLVLEDVQTGRQTDVNVMVRAQVSVPAP